MSTFLAVMNGANFRPASAKEIIKSLEVGELLTLERDPDNAYDENAIKVIHPDSGEFIGFVEKDVALELAPLIDDGIEIESVEIVSFVATLKPHLKIVLAE